MFKVFHEDFLLCHSWVVCDKSVGFSEVLIHDLADVIGSFNENILLAALFFSLLWFFFLFFNFFLLFNWGWNWHLFLFSLNLDLFNFRFSDNWFLFNLLFAFFLILFLHVWAFKLFVVCMHELFEVVSHLLEVFSTLSKLSLALFWFHIST